MQLKKLFDVGLKVLLPASLILMFLYGVIYLFSSNEIKMAEQERYQIEYNKLHLPLPKPLSEIQKDLYERPLDKCDKVWIFKETDTMKLDTLWCKKVNSVYVVGLSVNCIKTNHPNMRLIGRISLTYSAEGQLLGISNGDAKIVETIE